MTPDLLTVKEVAAILRVHPNAVYDLARNRQIQYVRIGGRIRFPRVAVEEFLRSNTVSPKGYFTSVNRRRLRNHQPGIGAVGEEPQQVSKDPDNDKPHPSHPGLSLRRS